jgi:hypothetical protein
VFESVVNVRPAMIVNDLHHMLETAIAADVVFVCADGERVSTHRCVLSIASSVLSNLIANATVKHHGDLPVVIELADVNHCALSHLLYYLYTFDPSHIDLENIKPVLALADTFKVRHLLASLEYLDCKTCEEATSQTIITRNYNALIQSAVEMGMKRSAIECALSQIRQRKMCTAQFQTDEKKKDDTKEKHESDERKVSLTSPEIDMNELLDFFKERRSTLALSHHSIDVSNTTHTFNKVCDERLYILCL